MGGGNSRPAAIYVESRSVVCSARLYFHKQQSVRGSRFNAVHLLSLFFEIKSVYFMFGADILIK